MKEHLEETTRDISTVNDFIEEAVKMCLRRMSRFDDIKSDYDRSMFWELYKRLADEFVYDLKFLEVDDVPFRFRDNKPKFLRILWHCYFLAELQDLMNTEQDFADMVHAALSNERTYYNYTERIDKMIRRRYRIPER